MMMKTKTVNGKPYQMPPSLRSGGLWTSSE